MASIARLNTQLKKHCLSTTVQRADGSIAVRDDGTVWPSEKEMQTRVSHWLRDQEHVGHIGAVATTLHGLRVPWARTTPDTLRPSRTLSGPLSG
jgi:hypothetical protein